MPFYRIFLSTTSFQTNIYRQQEGFETFYKTCISPWRFSAIIVPRKETVCVNFKFLGLGPRPMEFVHFDRSPRIYLFSIHLFMFREIYTLLIVVRDPLVDVASLSVSLVATEVVRNLNQIRDIFCTTD